MFYLLEKKHAIRIEFTFIHLGVCTQKHVLYVISANVLLSLKKKKSVKKKAYLETSMKAKTTVLPEGMSFMNLHVEAHLELTDGNTC